VCINLLRSNYSPLITLKNLAIACQLLLDREPSHIDYLNKKVAEMIEHDPEGFRAKVKRTMRGGEIDGVIFHKFIN
jgi:ubiquitin-conjugating enzyme E2 M